MTNEISMVARASEIQSLNEIQSMIYVVRGKQVMMDK